MTPNKTRNDLRTTRKVDHDGSNVVSVKSDELRRSATVSEVCRRDYKADNRATCSKSDLCQLGRSNREKKESVEFVHIRDGVEVAKFGPRNLGLVMDKLKTITYSGACWVNGKNVEWLRANNSLPRAFFTQKHKLSLGEGYIGENLCFGTFSSREKTPSPSSFVGVFP